MEVIKIVQWRTKNHIRKQQGLDEYCDKSFFGTVVKDACRVLYPVIIGLSDTFTLQIGRADLLANTN